MYMDVLDEEEVETPEERARQRDARRRIESLERVLAVEPPLDEWTPGAVFEPPYGSPIEEDLAWQACKLLHPETRMVPQHRCNCGGVRYRLDFSLQRGDHFIGVECDGRDFHRDYARDVDRDMHILMQTDVQRIYRFRGCDLHWRINGCLKALADAEPWAFTTRGRIVLEVAYLNLERSGDIIPIIHEQEALEVPW